MSLQDQIRFLEKFEQNLNRSSRTYRRYNANKQDHSFTVSKKALHAGITDALDIGLEGNKKKHELIPKVLAALEVHTLNVISQITTNIKARHANTQSKVNIKIWKDTPEYFRCTFFASQNGLSNVYKQVYRSYDRILNAYARIVSEVTEHIIGQSFGDKAKDYFNLEHLHESGVAESLAKDALMDALGENTDSNDREVLDWLKHSGLDVRIIRTTATNKMVVFIGSKARNAQEAKETRTRKEDLLKFLPEIREEITKSRKKIPYLSGSDSFVDINRKKLLKKVSDEFGKGKGGTRKSNAKIILKESVTIKHSNTTAKSKKPPPVSKSIKGMALTRLAGKKATPKRRVKKGVASSPLRLIGIINEKLPQTVAKNMGSPKLNMRTGRFASSVRLVDVATTAKGFPSFGYTYQRDPYEVFESGSGSRFSSVERDPRTLIDSSIREIAANLALGRFFTRRV